MQLKAISLTASALVMALSVAHSDIAYAQGGTVQIPLDYSFSGYRGMVVADSAKGPVVVQSADSTKIGRVIDSVNDIPVKTASEFLLAMRMAGQSSTITLAFRPSEGPTKTVDEILRDFAFQDTPGGVMITRAPSQTEI